MSCGGQLVFFDENDLKYQKAMRGCEWHLIYEIALYQFTILQKLLIVQWIQWKGVLFLLPQDTIYLHLFRFHIWAPDWLRCLTAACPELCLRLPFPGQAGPSTKQLPIEGPSQTWKEKWRRTVRNLPQHLLEPRPLRTGLSSEGGARNPECLAP